MTKMTKKKQEKLNQIKINALMGNDTHYTSAQNDFYEIIEINKAFGEAAEVSQEEFYQKIYELSDQNPCFNETLDILNLGQQIIEMKKNKNTDNSSIKDLELEVRQYERDNIIPTDAAAYAYYNIGILYQDLMPFNQINGEKELSDSGKNVFRRALKLTSDIRLIELISDEMNISSANDLEILRETYYRALNNPENPDLFSTYYNCAKTYLQTPENNVKKISYQQTNSDSSTNDEMALSYFMAALDYTDDCHDKQKVLRHIRDIQKKTSPDDYYKTSMELADLMTGLIKAKFLCELSSEKILTEKQQKQSLIASARHLSTPDMAPQGHKEILWKKLEKAAKTLSFAPEETKELQQIKKAYNKNLKPALKVSKTKNR